MKIDDRLTAGGLKDAFRVHKEVRAQLKERPPLVSRDKRGAV